MSRTAAAWPGVLLAGLALAGGLGLAGWLAARSPLQRAWLAAGEGSSYAVAGTTTARTVDGVATFDVAGTGDGAGGLEVRIRPLDGVAGAQAVAASYRIRWPDVAVETDRGPNGTPNARPARVPMAQPAFDPHALGLILPAGDPLALLPAAYAPADVGPDEVDGRSCRRVTFLLNGLAYVPWWQRHSRYLPINGNNGPLEKLSGDGTLWYEPASGRPCRIAARLTLPRLAGDQPGVGEVDWTYDRWGRAR